jgi:hypothetical protein
VNILFLAGCTLAVAPTIWFQRFDGLSLLGLIVMAVSAFVIMARRSKS